jgi:hypothetical protein
MHESAILLEKYIVSYKYKISTIYPKPKDISDTLQTLKRNGIAESIQKCARMLLADNFESCQQIGNRFLNFQWRMRTAHIGLHPAGTERNNVNAGGGKIDCCRFCKLIQCALNIYILCRLFNHFLTFVIRYA